MYNIFLLSCVTVTFILVYGMSMALSFACDFQINVNNLFSVSDENCTHHPGLWATLLPDIYLQI